MSNLKIAVQIRKVRDPQGNESLKATVPMRLMFEKNFDAKWLNEELKKFEEGYFKIMSDLKDIVKFIKSKDVKQKVLLYWNFGDRVYKYINNNKNNPLFLRNVSVYLTRDLVVSKKFINRCKKFRLLYPDIAKVDPCRSFDSYVATFEGGYISAKRRIQMGLKSQKEEAKDA